MNAPAVDLGHTPGLYYTLAYFLSSLLFLSQNRRRLTGWRLAGAAVLFLLVLSAFMIVTGGADGALFIVSMLVIFGLIFFFMFAAADMPWRKALYFSTRVFILGEFAASLEWQLFYFSLSYFGLPLNMGVNLLFLLVIHFAVFGGAYLLERRYREQNETGLRITGRELSVALILAFIVFLVSNLSYATPNTPFSSDVRADIFAIRTLVDLGGAGALLAYHVQLCEMNARMEKEYLQTLLRMQEENYRVSAESVELVNRKYHDLKHQIGLLRSELGAGEKTEILDAVERDIRSYEAQNKTGNRVLDILLAAKSLQCQDEGISLTVVADGKELDFMDTADISVLFGNALDNAIESVEKIADREQRLIHLSVARQRGFLRVRLENRCEGSPRFAGGLPLTTKRDSGFHGFGMKSIRSVAEKYGGSMTAKLENGWFELRLLLPLKEKEPLNQSPRTQS